MIEITLVRDGLESEETESLEVKERTTIRELLEEKGIERQEVLVSRNGTILTDNHELSDGDEIEVVDVIAGG